MGMGMADPMQCQCLGSSNPGTDIEIQPIEAEESCFTNSECPITHACINSVCQNPCHDLLCPAGKVCRVRKHKAVCTCTRSSCEGEISICLNDRGCPGNRACRNFQCVDPCLDTECPSNIPCLVAQHTAICKI